MRVLITRPEREAAALATALSQRGHVPVIAPLFRLDLLSPPADFAEALANSQAVLLTSANGARALAEASEQRSKLILAVGDATAAAAEGLGFTSVVSAAGDGAALGQLARERLDAKASPLLHVCGADVADTLELDGFEVRRVPLYEARAVSDLPDSARAALEARAVDVATFFSPRAAELFARLLANARLSETCRAVTALAISPMALEPLKILPFKVAIAAARPTRQAILDEIDRLAEAGVQQAPARPIMSDTSSSAPPEPPLRLTTPVSEPAPFAAPAPQIIRTRSGIGVFGAFIVSLIAAAIVVAGAQLSQPYWPEEARAIWRGPSGATAASANTAAVDAAKQELTARLDDLEKRVRGLANTAAQPATPAAPDPAVAALRSRIETLESKPAAPAPTGDAEKEAAALRLEIATLRAAMQALDQAVAGQKDQARSLSEALDKAKAESSRSSADEQKALAAARASTLIGIAARLGVALDSGRPFAQDVALLAPLAQEDKKVAEFADALKAPAQTGVTPHDLLIAEFPPMAKAAMADDLSDDSFGQRVLGKLKSLVSLRRIGADVAGDTVEAKLARAEAALKTGNLAKAVEQVKSLPPIAQRAAKTWLAQAEAHLAAQQTIDQLAAHAVGLLGATRAP